MIDYSYIAAYIVCGGQSRRMGQNKSDLQWNGKSFLEWCIEAVLPITDGVTLVANDPAYVKWGYPVLRDHYPGKGPVAGIHAALFASTHPFNLILSCDAPTISTELLQYLITHCDVKDDVTYIRKENKAFPLIGLYKTTLARHFDKSLINGHLRLMQVITSRQCHAVDIPRAYYDQVQNINTPAEYAQLKALVQ